MKLYITSGDLQFITIADDYMEGCYKALKKARREGIRLDKYFYISERGFRGPSDDDPIDTDHVPEEQIKVDEIKDDD